MSAPDIDLAATVNALFNCRQPTSSGPCVLPAPHHDQCQAMPPVVARCRLCRGRTRVPGTDDTCPRCGGAGIETQETA